jgi:hypothetical protein
LAADPPALHEDAALAAEVHQVPDDQEVAGQIQPLDEIQLARDLRARAVVIRPVPIPRAHLRDLPEKRRHRFARRHGVLGEAVAQIGHRVLEPIGQRTRGGNGVGAIGEERGHRVRRLQIPLGVAHQAAAGEIERGLVLQAREDVVQRTFVGRGEPHAVGGDERHAIRVGQIDERVVVVGFVAIQMPLQLHVDLLAPEDADQPIEQAADAVLPRAQQVPARQRDEAAHPAVERVERERPFSFRRRELHGGDETTEVLIARPRGDQNRKDEGRRTRDEGGG